jgi:hypothetical protein
MHVISGQTESVCQLMCTTMLFKQSRVTMPTQRTMLPSLGQIRPLSFRLTLQLAITDYTNMSARHEESGLDCCLKPAKHRAARTLRMPQLAAVAHSLFAKRTFIYLDMNHRRRETKRLWGFSKSERNIKPTRGHASQAQVCIHIHVPGSQFSARAVGPTAGSLLRES